MTQDIKKEVITINIILNNNNYGLTNDAKILCKFIEQTFYQDKNIEVKLRPVNYFSYETGKVDINFFLEIPNPLLLHYAKINILIPNQEWFYTTWIPYLEDFDYIWCKTLYGKSIFDKITSKEKVKYIGWTSIDRYSEENSQCVKKFLHLSGKSLHKGTQNIIDNWSLDNPELIIVTHSKKIKKKTQDNISYIEKRLDDDDLIKLMNKYVWHLCLSECEGFGHYIYESLSSKGIVLSTNSRPMSDIIDNQYLVKVNKIEKNDDFLDNRSIFDIDDFKVKIKELLNSDDNHIELSRNNNRKWFLDNLKLFRTNIRENLALLKKRIKNDYNPKIPLEISSKVDDLPYVSIVTLTRNRIEFSQLMIGNFTGIDYPSDKLEWIIVDDSDDGSELDLKDKPFFEKINYIKLSKVLSIGEKRNLAIKNAKYDYICFMDDDDIYFPRNLLIRLAYLNFYKKRCCYCSTIGSFHINKIISHINVPPFPLPFYQRVSEASLLFKKDFWLDKNFSDTNIQEASGFMIGRYSDCVEIPWKHVFISLLHNKNISNRITLGDEPNGCHFGLSDELFTYITNLQK